ncbi:MULTISPECIES: hypothetical protein [Bradyrhizobium]
MPVLPISLPNVRKLDQMPSWPEWVDLRVRSMKDECQRSLVDGKYRTLPTLPVNLVLTRDQREVIERYVSDVNALLQQTPARHEDSERATLAKITVLLMGQFRNARLTAVEAEIAGKHYLLALRDVPSWAVEIAVDSWSSGLCGNDEHGEPYDCAWWPVPFVLKKIAINVTFPLYKQTRTLHRLLAAEPIVEFSDEHRASMRARVAGLLPSPRA